MRLAIVWAILTAVLAIGTSQANATHTTALTQAQEENFWLAWTAPVNVSSSPQAEPEATWPTLGVSADGEVVYLAWSDDRDGTKNIYYATSADKGWNWSAAQRVVATERESLRPSMSISGTTPFIAWADQHPEPDQDKYSTLQIRLGDTAPMTVPNPRISVASAPQLIHSLDGELYLATQGGMDNLTDILFGRRDVHSSTWPTLTVVFDHTTIGSAEPAIAVSQDGQTLHLVWQETFSPNASKIYYMRGQRSGDDIVWNTHLSLSDGITLSVRPDIAVVNNTLYVAWGEQSGSGQAKLQNQFVRFSRSTDGGTTWSTPVRIAQEAFSANNILPTNIAPVVGVTPSGAVCVVWHGFRADAPYEAEEVYASCSTDHGDSWAAPVNISNSLEDISIRPVLAVGSDGVLHVAWQEYVGPSAVSNYQVFYARSLPFTVMLPLIVR